ncbi:MAG: ferrous iron transporter B [Ilumatobacteraceae bacterium]
MSKNCHGCDACGGNAPPAARRIALIGSPNAGKTTVFNQLTGGRAKTANHPGVTVTRREGITRIGETEVLVVDLPGTYSLVPTSPDEAVVDEYLAGRLPDAEVPEAIVLVADVTSIERSLLLVAETLALGRPTCLVLTMIDELGERGGSLDAEALAASLGIPVVPVVAHRGVGVEELRERVGDVEHWSRPTYELPADDAGRARWVDWVLAAAGARRPEPSRRTELVDRVVLHPIGGLVLFAAVMVAFFQAIFVLAAPIQDALDRVVAWAADGVMRLVPGWPGQLIGEGAIAGAGAVAVFLPQIVLLFLIISFLESVGYLSRAAFVIDRFMSRFGLEGRCFVSMLSSFACAVPGIMSTRSIPSSRDRIATIIAARS